MDELFNCEDIFMSAMISDLTMKPPKLMELASKLGTGSVLCGSCNEGKSISYHHGHSGKRNNCSNLIKQFYGHQTLVARRSLEMHVPCGQN